MITLLYGVLNMDSVQDYIREKVVAELRAKLKTEVSIRDLHFQPFTSLELVGVYLEGQDKKKILEADQIFANISLVDLLQKKITINTLKINDFELHLNKETPKSPLNIQFIIDAFKSDNQDKKQPINLKLSAVSLSDGHFFYDIKDQEKKEYFDSNHIEISDFGARLALKSLRPDSINVQVKKLFFKEKSGLNVENLTTRIITQGKKIYIKGFKLDLPNTHLQFQKCEFDLTENDSTKSLLANAKFDVEINSSYIAPQDISAFVPQLQNFSDKLYLKTKVSGSVEDLIVDDLSLNYGESVRLLANVEVKDLADPSKTYVLGSIDEFYLNSNGVLTLINNFSNVRKGLPEQLKNLGEISFVGDVSGYLKELVAFGSLRSSVGDLSTDILFGFNPSSGIDSYFKGNISSPNLQLGRILNNTDLNNFSFDLSVDLKKHTQKPIGGHVSGTIHEIDFRGYTYKNIELDGNYDGKKVDGSVDIDDPNGRLSVNGFIDLSNKIPELNIRAFLEKLNMSALKLTDKYPKSLLSLNLSANFVGNNIDDMSGFLKLDSLFFDTSGKDLFFDKILIEASGSKEDRRLSIKSDIINGEVTGGFSFSTIGASLKESIRTYMPALLPVDNARGAVKENSLSFDFVINNTSDLSEVLKLPVVILSPARISGFYNNIFDKFKIEAFLPSLKFGGTIVKSGYFMTENSSGNLLANVTTLVSGKNNAMNQIELNLSGSNNVLDSKIEFKSDTENLYEGQFHLSANFDRDIKNKLITEVDVYPTSFTLNNFDWLVERSKIQIENGHINVDGLNIHNSDQTQSLFIDGRYSPQNSSDVLSVDLKKVNLSYVFDMLSIEALNFGGLATGTVRASSIKGKPYANVKLDVDDFAFNKATLGHLTLSGELDEETNKVMMNGSILTPDNDRTLVDGYINPVTQELSIDFDATRINVGFLNKYVASLFNNVSGKGSGKVRLFGNFSDVTVEGKAFVENGNIGINFLNTNYVFTDTIYLDKNRIHFEKVQFKDSQNNIALISGEVTHHYFSNFVYRIEAEANNFLLYNVQETANPLFHGTVFASGNGSIFGDERVLNIDIRMKTDEKTKVRMNFMEEVANQYSFITYKGKEEEVAIQKDTTRRYTTRPMHSESGIEIKMNFYIDATPDATVELVMDPVGGDVLRGNGSGAMHFIWGTKTAPELYGTYTIDKGSYNFTFQKILERKFLIQQGSEVQFRGDPFGANLNVNAIYKLTANLNDLDEEIATRSGQANVPVQCELKLTGELRHPNVKLDINLPNADGEVQRQVKNLLDTEDMINRQIVYLLLMSKFHTPSNANTEHRTSDFAAVASATLSNQLGNILSQIDDRWHVGTNIRTSDGNFTSTEVELILSSNLLDDRLILNGNFGYRDDPNTQDAFIGDVDVEFLLNKSGTWRIKAYNHYNEKYYYTRTAIQTQGIGLMYKKDFDKLSELFNLKKLNFNLNKKDSSNVVVPDSMMKGSSLSNFIKLK